MPVNQLVAICNERHNRQERCATCPNDPCLNNCSACLEYIHRVGTQERSYNCDNIIYCYTCKFIFRYSSEIQHLLNLYSRVFKNATTVNMCSIGSGPCTELFGLYRLKMNYQLDFTINYKGFDLNTIWRPVHEIISDMPYFNTEFYYENVFNYYAEAVEYPHFLVLNYVISDILRTNREYIDEFIDGLCNLYSLMPNAFLIINDINLGQNNTEARYYYDVIVNRLQSVNQVNLKHIRRCHFINSQKAYFSYGGYHINNETLEMPNDDINRIFSPWVECRSAQLAIFKN